MGSRIVLAAVGSRGDTVPMGALGARLAGEGHDVTVLVHEPLAHTIPAHLPTICVPGDPDALLAGPAAEAVRRIDIRALNDSRHLFVDFLTSFADPTREALVSADLLVASTFAVVPTAVAARRGVPVMRAHLWPENEDLTGPMPLMPFSWRLPSPARRFARRGLRRMEPYLAGFDGGWHRGRLILHPHHAAGLTTATHGSLYAMSPRLVPPTHVGGVVTGWWWNPEEEPLDSHIATRLADDGPWAFVGFGSMPQKHPDDLLTDIDWAARRAGVRVVAQIPGAEGIDTGTVIGIGPAPHGALFPLVDVVVHHGGSGTTGAAVRAGVPSVVVPHFADQYYWAHRLHQVGVAPAALPRAFLTRERLAARLRAALSPSVRRRSIDLGRAVQAEDGTGVAVAAIARALDSRPGPSGRRP